jgi:hypothetical protein
MASITVPAAYLNDFREAVVVEIRDGTNAVKVNRKAIQDAADRGRDGWRETCEIDWRGSVRLLAQDGLLLHQLEAAEAGQEFTAEGDAATLGHVCQAFAEKVIGPRLMHLLNYAPISDNVAAEVHAAIERLTWAVDESARLS